MSVQPLMGLALQNDKLAQQKESMYLQALNNSDIGVILLEQKDNRRDIRMIGIQIATPIAGRDGDGNTIYTAHISGGRLEFVQVFGESRKIGRMIDTEANRRWLASHYEFEATTKDWLYKDKKIEAQIQTIRRLMDAEKKLSFLKIELAQLSDFAGTLDDMQTRLQGLREEANRYKDSPGILSAKNEQISALKADIEAWQELKAKVPELKREKTNQVNSVLAEIEILSGQIEKNEKPASEKDKKTREMEDEIDRLRKENAMLLGKVSAEDTEGGEVLSDQSEGPVEDQPVVEDAAATRGAGRQRLPRNAGVKVTD